MQQNPTEQNPSKKWPQGRLYTEAFKTGVFDFVETNAPFIGRVDKGVETSLHITEFAAIRIVHPHSRQGDYVNGSSCSPWVGSLCAGSLVQPLELVSTKSAGVT